MKYNITVAFLWCGRGSFWKDIWKHFPHKTLSYLSDRIEFLKRFHLAFTEQPNHIMLTLLSISLSTQSIHLSIDLSHSCSDDGFVRLLL